MFKVIAFLILLAPAAATATTASAETPMSGAEFDAYTRGKTLTYIEGGQPYGIEEYKADKQVTWAFDGDECQKGHWWEAETGLICFVYDAAPDQPQCWNFFKSETGLTALFADSTGERVLYEARRARQPLICLGPQVGV